MKIGSLIAGPAQACGPRVTLREAASMMVEGDLGSLIVGDGTSMVGIITERDIMSAVATGADTSTVMVEDWMTADPDSASPELEVREAAEWMLAVGYRHLPITQDGRIMGIASIKDILWAMADGT